MTWGTGPWGTGPFGITTDLTIAYAFPISTHEVVVVLSKPPQDVLGILPGDVRNLESWELSEPSTVRIIAVAEITPYKLPLQWVVRSATPLPNTTAIGRVKLTGLKDAGGAINGLPDFADFAGVTEEATATPTAKAATKGTAGRDLTNKPAPSVGGDTSLSGTLVIRGGDYTLTAGADLLKKLLIRRLTTTPGDLFHIPAYGVGLRVKEPLPAGDVVGLRARIERELSREPDVSNVVARVSQSSNTLTVRVTARLTSSGEDVSVGLFSPIGQTNG